MERLNIDQELVRRCNDASQFDAGDVIACDWKRTFERFAARFSDRGGLTQEQCEYLAVRERGWQGLCEKAAADALIRRASYVPVTVAGPSKYPAAQMGKRADRAMSAGVEWSEKAKRYLDNTAARLEALTPIESVLDRIRAHGTKFGEVIASDDPYALEKLEAKRDHYKKFQDRMKSENAYFRKHKTMIGCPGYTDADADALDRKIAADYYTKAPWGGYMLANNGTHIKSVEKRIAALREHREAQALEGFAFEESSTYPAGRVEADYEDDRLKIFFDEKPDGTGRDKLHSRGFNWSRRNGAWQRQLTKAAMRAAKEILGVMA